jgi:hypothetical protein
MRWYGNRMFATMSGNAWTFVVAVGVFMTLLGAFMACAMTALNLITPNGVARHRYCDV